MQDHKLFTATFERLSFISFMSAGLAELALKKYKSAAKHFLQAQFDHFEYKEVKNMS